MSFATFVALMLFMWAVTIGASYYIPRRLCGLLGVRKVRLPVFAFMTMSVIGIVSMGAVGTAEHVLLLPVIKSGLLWLGLAFYLLVFLLLYEILGAAFKIERKTAGFSVIALSIAVMSYGIWNARDYTVEYLDVPMPGLGKELSLFHIPDLQLGPFHGRETLARIVDDITRLEPDLVLINGDLVDGQEGLEADTLSLLEQIEKPVYFVRGNHDTYVGMDRLRRLLDQYGVRVLDNEVIDTHGIQLVGLDYMNPDNDSYDPHSSERKETIKSVMSELAIDPGIPSVFVHHSPVGIRYMHEAGADLVLAGHTHAGQMFPATLIARLQFPYLEGLYHYEDTAIHVSRGVGTFGPPARIGTRGEATLIRLVESAGNDSDEVIHTSLITRR